MGMPFFERKRKEKRRKRKMAYPWRRMGMPFFLLLLLMKLINLKRAFTNY